MGKTFRRKDRSDKNWYISFYEPSGRRVKRCIGPSKKTAENVLKKIEVEIAEGKYLDLKKDAKIGFEYFLDEFYKLYSLGLKSCSKTHSTYAKHFKEYFKGKYLNDIKVVDIERYKSERNKGSFEFEANEFNKKRTPEALIKAVSAGSGIDIPVADTPIDSLNVLLEKKDMYGLMKLRPKETLLLITKLEKGQHLSPYEFKKLNRLLIKANYPKETPKLQNKELAVGTVNRYLSFLRCVFNKAIAWDKFSGPNPVGRVKFFKENNTRLRYLEKDEIVKLLSNCEGILQPIVGVALNTGLRREDIFGLKWADVNFNVRIIYVRLPKGGEALEIPMNDEVFRILKAIGKNPNSEYVFCRKDGHRICDIRKSFWTALKKSDIKDFHFHDLRHTFASQLVMSGVDLNTVRELLGHKSLEMTLRYAHLSPGHKRRAVDILDQNINAKTSKPKNILVPVWSPEGHLTKGQKPLKSQVYELQGVA